MIKRTHGYIIHTGKSEFQISVYGRFQPVRIQVRTSDECYSREYSRTYAGRILKRARATGSLVSKHFFIDRV